MGVWLRKSSHGIHRIHRSFVALVLPRNSRNSQKFCCVCSPTDFTDQHRWLVASVLPRNSQNSQKFWGAVGCVGMAGCHTLLHLCASVPICGRYFSARMFCAFRGFCGNIVSHGFHRSTQMVGCINSPTEFTEFTEVWGCCWQRGYGRMPYPPNLCASVRICGSHFSARMFRVFRAFCGRCLSVRRFCAFRGFCGSHFSARRFRVFRAFCGRFFSTRRVSSVGDYSFSMRKRLTMPKTRA